MEEQFKIYTLNFDINKARELREAINDKSKFSIERIATGSKETRGDYNAWNRLCAAMTRLEDTILYVNNMELGKLGGGQSAFDFYEFINCSYVIIECIKVVAQVFDNKDIITQIENSTEIFGTKYSENGKDGTFFEYIRSICGVHPLCTSRKSEYLQGSTFHCCPFVSWTNRGYVSSKQHNDADLIAHIYVTNDRMPVNIELYINEFEQYLSKWINCISDVIDVKNKYVENKYEVLRKMPVKNLLDFDNDYVKYIEHLREEYIRRIDESMEYVLEEYIDIFKIKLSNADNRKKLEKYKTAIMYSLDFLKNSLQEMNFDGFENTGIEYPDRRMETNLYIELQSPNVLSGEFAKYSYEVQKVYNLASNSGSSIFDRQHTRHLLEKVKLLINKYVFFTNNECDEETYVLIKLALYLESLTRKSIINKNIPNHFQYRERLLTQAEIDELHQEEAATEFTPMSQIELEELLKKYGR